MLRIIIAIKKRTQLYQPHQQEQDVMSWRHHNEENVPNQPNISLLYISGGLAILNYLQNTCFANHYTELGPWFSQY